LVLNIGCNDQSITDLEVTKGNIAGKAWVYGQGNAIETPNSLQIILMSDQLNYSNTCGILNPSFAYAKILIPAKRGTFNISGFVGSESAVVRFYEGSASAKFLTAVSGFVQVVNINGYSVDGIIDVSLNDDNKLTYGAFFADYCN
jgi:hypothetical protein